MIMSVTAEEAGYIAGALAKRPARAIHHTGGRALPVAAADAFLALARADGIVDPGWTIDGLRIERVAATCWDYLAAAVWALPILVRS